MRILRNFRKPIASVLACAMVLVSAPIVSVQAAIVGTDEIVSSATSARSKVDAFLAREDVRKQIESFGVSPDEAAARVKSLSDDEVGQLAGRIDGLPAGEGVLTAIVGAILIVVLILLLTDLLGLTHVYGFTNKGALRK